MTLNNFNIHLGININIKEENLEKNRLLYLHNDIYSKEFTIFDDIKSSKEGDLESIFFNHNNNTYGNEGENYCNKQIYFIKDEKNLNDNPKNIRLIKTNEKNSTPQNILSSKKRKSKIKKKLISIKKSHTAFDDDNILRKVQVIFISFIIHYSNDVISHLFDGDRNVLYFKDIDYQYKKRVQRNYVENLKSKTIKEIIEFPISPKIKKNKEKENKTILKTILEKYPSIEAFFKTNYLDLFRQYFNNKNDIFKVNGRIIPLSERTKQKTFSSLIKENDVLKEKIKYVCINHLLNSYQRMKKPCFKIEKFE